MKMPNLIDIIEGRHNIANNSTVKSESKTYSFYKKDGDKTAVQIDAEDDDEADEKIKQITGQDPKKITKWSEDDDIDENALSLTNIYNHINELEDEGEEEICEDNTTSSLDGGEGMQQTPNAFRRKVKKPDDTIYSETINEYDENTEPQIVVDARKIVNSQNNGKISDPVTGKKLTCDLGTASLIIQLYDSDSVNSEMKAKFFTLPINKIVDFLWKRSSFKKNETKVVQPVNEVAYKEWVNDATMSPKQKINKAILEVARNLYEVDRLISRSAKLKTEINADQSIYWKNTVNKFTKINERLLKISSKIRNISQ